MEAPHALDDLLARPKVQVIGVRQNDLRAGASHVARAEAPYNGMRPDRHECGGLNVAVRQCEYAGASWSVGTLDPELEHQDG
jgi:hypothetical protein